jgi:hypothetical protein
MSTTQIALKYGLFIGIGVIAYNFLIFFLKLEDLQLDFLKAVMWAAGMSIGIQECKRKNDGLIKFKQALSVGALSSTIAGLIDGIYIYFYATILNPKYPQIHKAILLKIYGKTESTPEQQKILEQSLAFVSQPNILFLNAVFMSFFFGLFFGSILGLMTYNEK